MPKYVSIGGRWVDEDSIKPPEPKIEKEVKVEKVEVKPITKSKRKR